MSGDKPQVGDKVRITYNGVVTEADSTELTVQWHSSARDIEIIERALPKVGDVIIDVNELKRLPGGSVVRDTRSGCGISYSPYFKSSDGWLLPGRAASEYSSGIWPDSEIRLPVKVLAVGYRD